MAIDTANRGDMEAGVLEAIEAIRPALQSDGGDIVFKRIDDEGVVFVDLIGACGTCPVSTMTLKAGVENITRWLAVELARRGTGIRVNAIAPGFVIGDQNRSMLVGADGQPSERGAAIIERTPLGRFGEPEELVSTAIWLASDGARFVTGAVVPVDGGFSAFAGV